MSTFWFDEKKLLASSWAMFKLSHKIMYVRRVVHKQFKIAYPPLLAIWMKTSTCWIWLIQTRLIRSYHLIRSF